MWALSAALLLSAAPVQVVDAPVLLTPHLAPGSQASVEVQAARDSEWVLFPEVRDEHVSFTSGDVHFECGVDVPFGVRPVEYGVCLFPVTLVAGQPTALTLTARPVGPSEMSWQLVPRAAALHRVRTATLVVGMFLGLTLVMAAYNLLLFSRLRERAYLFYSLYLAGLFVNQLALSGVGFQYLFPEQPWLNQYVVTVPNQLNAVAALLFAREFLATQTAMPTADRWLRGLVGVELLGIIVVLVLPIGPASAFMSLGILACCVLLLVVSARGVALGNGPARIFLAAWSLFLVGMIVNHLVSLRVVPASDLTRQGFMFGTAVEVVLLSRALADRIQLLRAERDGARERTLLVERLTRYFPAKLVTRILSEKNADDLGQHKRRVTMLFSDLTGFTSFTDNSKPERVSQVLNEYLAEMVPIIERFGGTIDKVMGDGIMALFGAADDMAPQEQARAAVETGLAMQRKLSELNGKWQREDLAQPIRMRIGVHQDEVTVGNFGTSALKSFTAIGGGVNLAARLESSCTPGRVQVSEAMHALTASDFSWLPPQEKLLKGFATPRILYEVEP